MTSVARELGAAAVGAEALGARVRDGVVVGFAEVFGLTPAAWDCVERAVAPGAE